MRYFLVFASYIITAVSFYLLGVWVADGPR